MLGPRIRSIGRFSGATTWTSISRARSAAATSSPMKLAPSTTDYGGPLAEGLMVGDTVRCPWHHACFSLRTGEALRPPALSPVACWAVEPRDGKLFVTIKKEGSKPRLALGTNKQGAVVGAAASCE